MHKCETEKMLKIWKFHFIWQRFLQTTKNFEQECWFRINLLDLREQRIQCCSRKLALLHFYHFLFFFYRIMCISNSSCSFCCNVSLAASPYSSILKWCWYHRTLTIVVSCYVLCTDTERKIPKTMHMTLCWLCWLFCYFLFFYSLHS